jgi:MoxR-like ATPase
MADPFSIVAGAISLAHICNRLGSFLRNVSEGSQRIDGDLEALSHEIASLATVNDLIKTSFESDLSGAADPAHRSTIVNLWQATEATLENCKITVEKLENLVTSIVELHTPKALSKLDGVRKYLKKQSKEEEFGQLRHKLASYRAALQIILTAVDM